MSNARCYFRIDLQTVCGCTSRHLRHSRWRGGDCKSGVPSLESHPFTPYAHPEPEILPCPFCGSDDVEVIDANGYAVRCGTCYGRGGSALIAEEAIASWNRRAEAQR
jgi:Lar family restriction alleviation protein